MYIDILKKTIKNTSLLVTLALLPFSGAWAGEINEHLGGHYSMYKYHALENKAAIFDLINNVNNLEEKLSEINQVEDNVETEWQSITEKQNFSLEQIENAMNALRNRNEIKTFLVGNNLGILKFQLVQIKEQIMALNALALRAENSTMKTQISDQVKFLQEEQVKVKNFIIEQEKKFKLFGWFVAML